MKQTGQLLKSKREEKRLSLNEISMATKISVRILSAIEDGNMKALPSRTFVRGFVASYAEFLKLDRDEVVKLFNEENNISPLNKEQTTSNSINPKNTKPFLKPSSSGSKIIIVIVIIILISVIIAVNNQITKYQNEAENLNPPPKNIESITDNEKPPVLADKIDSPTLSKEPVKNDKPMAPVNNPKKIELLKKEQHHDPTKTAAKRETKDIIQPVEQEPKIIEKKEKPIQQKPAAINKQPVTAKKNTLKPKKIQEKQKEVVKPKVEKPKAEVFTKKLQEIIIEALDEVQLKYSGKDGSKSIKLEVDQVYTIKVSGKVNLEFSDGGAINIIRNGADLGVPGDLGKPLKLTLPKK